MWLSKQVKQKKKLNPFMKEDKRKRLLKKRSPEAWNKIITEPDSLLIDLLSEATEKLCGFKPELTETTQFLKTYEGGFLLSPLEEFLAKPTKPITWQANSPKNEKISQNALIPHIVSEDIRITQNELIHYIVRVLQKHEGRAPKQVVDDEIFMELKHIFNQPHYQKVNAQGTPRWNNHLAWAKQSAVKKGLIKEPAYSGHGIWELTSKK